jgi:hypothetical protein
VVVVSVQSTIGTIRLRWAVVELTAFLRGPHAPVHAMLEL